MESTFDSSERISKAAPSGASASLVLRVVRRRTVGFAVERLAVRVGLFFGAGIQRNLSKETNFTGREFPRTGLTSEKPAVVITQHPPLSKGSRPTWPKLPTRSITQPKTIGEPFALNCGCREASQTLKTYRNPH
jgi:hypothetical protein